MRNVKLTNFIFVLALFTLLTQFVVADELNNIFPTMNTNTQQIQQPVVNYVTQPQVQNTQPVVNYVTQPQVQNTQPVVNYVTQPQVQNTQPVVNYVTQPQVQNTQIYDQLGNSNNDYKKFGININLFGSYNTVFDSIESLRKEMYERYFGIGTGANLWYRFSKNFGYFFGVEGNFYIKSKEVFIYKSMQEDGGYGYDYYNQSGFLFKERFDFYGKVGLKIGGDNFNVNPYVLLGTVYANFSGYCESGYYDTYDNAYYVANLVGYKDGKAYGVKVGLGGDIVIMKHLLLGIKYTASIYNLNKTFNDFRLYDSFFSLSNKHIVHNVSLNLGISLM